jgi:hypothetical protein
LAHHKSAQGAVLYQDARFITIGRFQYGFFAYPLLILALIGSVSTGVAWHVGLALLLFASPITICEWRMRKMGFQITGETIELIRPLNRTRIGWNEIERFDLIIPPGPVEYGNRRVAVKRRAWHGHVPRSRMPIPTLWITVPARFPWSPFRHPTELKTSTGERIPDVVGFLNDQLAARATPLIHREPAA